MKIKNITLTTSEGAMWWIKDDIDLKKINESLYLKQQLGLLNWKRTGTIRELRNKYFGMIKQLNSDVSTGYTDSALHESIKPLVLNKFREFNHLFTNEQPEISTKNLNAEGWKMTIEELKVVANDVFGYVFPKD